jgi:hypothetical protein
MTSEPRPRGPVDWARQQAAEREQQPAAGDLQQRIAQAVRDTPARYPDDIAAAVWRVVGREIERMKLLVAASESDAHAVRMAAQYADKAIENGERAERAEAVVARVREEAQWLRRNYPGLTQLHSRLDAALDPPAPNATDGCTTSCDGATGIRGLLEHVGIDTTGRDITVAGRVVDAAPAHNAGPSVAECAQADRRWSLEKHGE